MHRPAQRLTRILVSAAAVPAMLVAAGCSSDSGSDSGDDAKKDSGAQSSASPTKAGTVVKEAAYAKLPEPCKVFSSKTLGELVPKGAKSGKEGRSDDTATRGSCTWDSLDDNGVKGSQFRWLSVSLLRFESDASRGTGEKLAATYYGSQVQDVKSVSGATNAKSEPVSGTGNEATSVSYDLKKKEGTFKQQSVVARTENVVVSVDYNGAGLAGEKAPSAEDLSKAALKAAKEAVQAVVTANQAGGSGTGSGESASASPSKGASETPAKDTKPSASASKSPSKKD
ncbi:DUF3558 domain-containing protein [Streptomyces sp. HC44]|uniref:DUF3558 domain-containing protein n=1 Tax=Streptomyces scabichelini TaxID=2711217 RepID=A0A6G4VMH5_9ACTN|nr:DUF3558 domain-containing protein [Streptomyces scabichelini]NGO15388.1 DUF3558 domain-containing protein [Streptomyces scabichelini]